MLWNRTQSCNCSSCVSLDVDFAPSGSNLNQIYTSSDCHKGIIWKLQWCLEHVTVGGSLHHRRDSNIFSLICLEIKHNNNSWLKKGEKEHNHPLIDISMCSGQCSSLPHQCYSISEIEIFSPPQKSSHYLFVCLTDVYHAGGCLKFRPWTTTNKKSIQSFSRSEKKIEKKSKQMSKKWRA